MHERHTPLNLALNLRHL